MNKVALPDSGKEISQIAIIVYLVYLLFATLFPFQWQFPERHQLPWPFGPSQIELPDLFVNTLLFIPFGFLFYFLLPKTTTYDCIKRTIIVGGAISLLIETLQIMIPARFPSLQDLVLNAMGSGIGAMIATFAQQKKINTYLFPHLQKIILGGVVLYTTFLLMLAAYSQEPTEHWEKGASKGAKVLIGNNTKEEHPWKGRLISAAIDDRVWSKDDIQRQFQNGPNNSVETRSQENPSRIYRFGKDQIFKVTDRIRKTKQFTVEVWFYPEKQFDKGGRILSLENEDRGFFYLHQYPDKISFVVKGTPWVRGAARWKTKNLPENRPIHLVGLYQVGVLQLYANGEKKGQTSIVNGLFLLSNKINVDYMSPVIGRSLFTVLLFFPLGCLLAMASQNNTGRVIGLKIVLGLFLVGGIVVISAQKSPLFFTPNIQWVPVAALLFGVFIGEIMKPSINDKKDQLW